MHSQSLPWQAVDLGHGLRCPTHKLQRAGSRVKTELARGACALWHDLAAPASGLACFLRSQANVGTEQTRARGVHNNGELPAGMWVDIAAAGVMEAVVNKDWRRAMADNGLGPMCSPGRAGIQDVLGCCLPLPLMPPTEEQMATLVGSARDGFRNSVLRASLRLAGARAALGPPGVGARIVAARLPGFAAVAAGEAVPPGAAASSSGGGHPGVAAAAVPPWAPRRTRSGAEY